MGADRDRDRDVDRDRDRDRGVPEDWIEHRRDDGELLGWIVPEGEEFTAVDRLGRAWPPTDWFGAESRLEDRGLGYLAEPFALRLPADTWIRVRIVEVSTAGIVVKEEDYGDVTRPSPRHRLAFPAGAELRAGSPPASSADE